MSLLPHHLPMSSPVESVFAALDAHEASNISRLAQAVAIPSVSGEAASRPHVHRMASWLVSQLQKAGATTSLRPMGRHTLEGSDLELPPVILAETGSDPRKKTLLVYGHYDVMPASKSDGWATDPFELTVDSDGRMWGRGASDDKGPVLGWINVLDAHRRAGVDLPVNVKMCFEGMEESGSVGLHDLIVQEKHSFFASVDAICISDNSWLANRPCLTHGLRGIQYFQLHVEGPGVDLHSGLFGGMVHEPMTDLMWVLSQLVSPQGKILVPGIEDLVCPVQAGEVERYEAMDFNLATLRESAHADVGRWESKSKLLMAKMRYPCLSIHSIESSAGPGPKTAIPARVMARFSLRLVPDLTPDTVIALVNKYIDTLWAQLDTKCTKRLEANPGGKAWAADPTHWNYLAASHAIKRVWGIDPDLTREGGSIPVALTFAEVLEKNLLLLPMGRDDGAHGIEKLYKLNYTQGSKVMAAYLHELAEIHEA